MEAKSDGELIVVTATKAEWDGVLRDFTLTMRRTKSTEDLVHWLINQGVYDE